MDADVNLKSLPYRKCVGIVVFNHEGQVWVGRRLMAPAHADIDGSHRWQLPFKEELMKMKTIRGSISRTL